MVKKILISTFVFIILSVSTYLYFISELNHQVKTCINKINTLPELPNLFIKDHTFEEANFFIPNTFNIRNIRSFIIDKEFFINALFQFSIEAININFNLFSEKKFQLKIKGLRIKLNKLNLEKNGLSNWLTDKDDQLNVYFNTIEVNDLQITNTSIKNIYLSILKLGLYGKSDGIVKGDGYISFRDISSINRIPFKIVNIDSNHSSLLFNQQDMDSVANNFSLNDGPKAIERIFQQNPINIITLMDMFAYISSQTIKYPDLQRIKIENYNILLFSFLSKIYFSNETYTKELEPLFKMIFRSKNITDRDYDYYIATGINKYQESIKENDLRYSVRK